jgi:PilZ domain
VSERPPGADRRRTPRVAVLQRIHCELVAQNVPLTLINLSLGGFLIECPIDLRIGTVREFRFRTASAQTVTFRARVVRRLCISSGPKALYGIGLVFIDEGHATASAVGELMAALDADQILTNTPA